MSSRRPTRRVVLGATLAAAMPSLSRTQESPHVDNEKPADVRIRMTFSGMSMIAMLYDNPSARDFASMLPLDLSIQDYGTNEKIVHLPRKLTEDGAGPFANERPGDLCYFRPWGNLALFRAPYRWEGLIRLGRFEEGFDALLKRGEFPVRIELL